MQKVRFTRCIHLIFVFLQGFWTQAHSGVTKVSIESYQVASLYRSAFESKTAFDFASFLIHEILLND